MHGLEQKERKMRCVSAILWGTFLLTLFILEGYLWFLPTNGSAETTLTPEEPEDDDKENKEQQETEEKEESFTPSLREAMLNVTLPLKVDRRIANVLDQEFFAKNCGPSTPGLAFVPIMNGLGAHFIMLGGGMNHALATRRMVYSRNPDSYTYSKSEWCVHGIWCFFHPVTWCTEAEINPSSEAGIAAQAEGYAWIGQSKKMLNNKSLEQTTDQYTDTDPRLISVFPDYHDWRKPPMQDWSGSLYIPPQFIPQGQEDAWHQVRFSKNVSALAALPGGIREASKLMMWWRSGILAYIFQPLPWVMEVVKQRINETGLVDKSAVIGIHIRRGDKQKADGPPPRHVKVYLELAWELRRIHGVRRLYIATDDSEAVTREMEEFKSDWEHVLIPDSGMKQGYDQLELVKTRNMKDIGANSIADLWLLSQCQYLVVALDSWFSELAYMLSFAKGNLVDARHPDGNEFVIGKKNGMVGWDHFVP